MLEIPVLSDEQIDDFEREGFLVVRSAFGAETTARIERWCDELTAMPEVPGKHWVYWEKSLINPNEKFAPGSRIFPAIMLDLPS